MFSYQTQEMELFVLLPDIYHFIIFYIFFFTSLTKARNQIIGNIKLYKKEQKETKWDSDNADFTKKTNNFLQSVNYLNCRVTLMVPYLKSWTMIALCMNEVYLFGVILRRIFKGYFNYNEFLLFIIVQLYDSVLLTYKYFKILILSWFYSMNN